MTSFKKFLSQNKNKYADKINEDLLFKIRQENLAEYMIKAFKTITSRHLKIKSWELIKDESKFDPNQLNVTYIKNNKNKKFDKRLPIERSRYDLLRITFHVSNVVSAKTGDLMEYDVVKEFLLFKQVDKYYYMIDGNKYYPTYQIVDASTYNRKNYLSMRTNQSPIIYKRTMTDIYDIYGEKFTVPMYELCLFKQKVNSLLFYLALFGYENTLIYMQMDEIIETSHNAKHDKEKQYCFMTENGLYIKVIKYFFDNDLFTRNMVYSLLDVLKNFTSMIDVYDENHSNYNIELGKVLTKTEIDDVKKFIKGKGFLLSFSGLLDEMTKDELRLKDFNKASIFAILRWIMRNFNELKAKDNMDLCNKRIRLGEYMAVHVINRLSSRKKKFIMAQSSGKVTDKDISDVLNLDKDFITKTITGSKSSLLRYDNAVNDTDFFTAFKASFKGIGSIGEKSSNSVNINFRGLHPSYVGKFDINNTNNSDPGMNASFTPFVKLFGKHFSNIDEPQSWDNNFKALYENYFNGKSYKYKSLDYYFDRERKSRKKLKRLEDVQNFIEKDPFTEEGLIIFDVTKPKVKILKIKKKNSEKKEPFEKAIKEIKKKKRGAKKRTEKRLKLKIKKKKTE